MRRRLEGKGAGGGSDFHDHHDEAGRRENDSDLDLGNNMTQPDNSEHKFKYLI